MGNRKVFSGALYTSGFSLLLNLIGALVTPIIIRELGKIQYGEWAISTSLVNFVFLFFIFGFRPLFIRRVSEGVVDLSVELSVQLFIRFFFGVLGVLVSVILCSVIGYSGNVFKCLCVYSLSWLMSSVWVVFADVLQGKQDLKTLSCVNFFAGIVLTALSVIAVLFFNGPVILAVSYLFGPFTSLVCLWIIVHRKYCKVKINVDFSLVKARFFEAKLVGISQIFAALRDRLEHLLVPKLAGTENYGLFSASTVPNDRLGIVSTSLGDAFFAPIARAAKESQEAVVDQICNLILAAIICCLSLAFILAFLSPVIASILLPLSINESKKIIFITAWSLPLLAMWQVMIVSLQATEAHDEAARINLWTTGASILVALVLILRFGLIGTAVSQLTRPLIGCLLYFSVFKRHFPNVFIRTFRPKLIFSFILFGAMLWVGNRYFEASIHELMMTAPWVTKKIGVGTSLGDLQKSIFTVFEILIWLLVSLFVFFVCAGYFDVIPVRKMMRGIKRE